VYLSDSVAMRTKTQVARVGTCSTAANRALTVAPLSCRPQRRRRWTLNGDFAGLSPTGVARYARETVAALDQLVGEAHPLTQNLALELVAPRVVELNNIPVRVLPEPISLRLPQMWVQAQLPRHVPGGLVSFCNLAPCFIRQHIVCIHDLHTSLMPESYPRGFRLAHRAILPTLGRFAARITTVSELSRDHLVSHGIAPLHKIAVTYNGSDHTARWDAARATIQIPTTRPFVLVLGRPQKYKNMELVFKIAAGLDALGVDIVMAGDIDAAMYDIFSSLRPANLYAVGRVSDDDLARLYTSALSFLFPSRIEGFGIPAVEALALGCPVIASTSPCLPEICGEGALYAHPDAPDDWIAAVSKLLSQPKFARDLTEKGRLRAMRYSWRGIAEMYLSLMSTVDAERQTGTAAGPFHVTGRAVE
jgi:glycosyltransferase involved in cell wall biosynthesis